MAEVNTQPANTKKEALDKERYELLNQIVDKLELPMIFLGFIWLVLLVIELLGKLNATLQAVSTFIWIAFIVDFLIKFIVAPKKLPFLKSNILTLISLALPALRIFRIARILRTLRAVRGLRLVKVIGSLNRGMRSLSASMGRRKLGYMLALTLVVLFTGAAGMFAFEQDAENGFRDYGEALWWTAMLLTSLGSEFWPKSPEGRLLCFLLSLYGFAVFGYFTAILATFFIGRDAQDNDAELAGAKQIESLHTEVQLLRKELQQFIGYKQNT